MENVIECKNPSIENTVSGNRKLIKECLDVSNFILIQIAADDSLKETDVAITCLISDLVSQNQDLTLLLNTLLRIKNHITGGAD